MYFRGWEETNFTTPENFSNYLKKKKYDETQIKDHLDVYETDMINMINITVSVLKEHVEVHLTNDIINTLENCVKILKHTKRNKASLCDIYVIIHLKICIF